MEQQLTKELIKSWIEKGHRKAYQSLVEYYVFLFNNIGCKAAVQEIEKELAIQLNFNSVYYAYRKYFGKKAGRKKTFTSLQSKTVEFKDANEIKSKMNF